MTARNILPRIGLLAIAIAFTATIGGCPPGVGNEGSGEGGGEGQSEGSGEGSGEGQTEGSGETGPILSVTPPDAVIVAAGATTQFQVTNLGDGQLIWSAQVVAGQSWITIQSGASGLDDGAITLAIAPHMSPGSRDALDPREGTLRVTSDNRTRDVAIVQDGDVEQFDLGFDSGFVDDNEYYNGYDDSWETIGADPVLWDGFSIPFVDDLSFDAGFFDGMFTAYNDGYFVAYRFAFIIGFSEGYEAAYAFDYLSFLDTDQHVELANGGFDDGYNDGYSEGRVFGALDFEIELPPDWLDAFLDWENGTDLVFEEINVGTGEFGDVFLYEYGTDPLARKARQRLDSTRAVIRGNTAKQLLDFARIFRESDITTLSVDPDSDRRSGRPLQLDSTWLDRIELLQSTPKQTTKTTARDDSPRAR